MYPSMMHNIANPATIKLSDASNYTIWKIQVLCVLESQDLVGFLDGTIQDPSKRVAGSDDYDDCLSSTTIHIQDYLKWKRTDHHLKAWILSSLSEQMLHKVADKDTAADVWFELEKICCPPSQHGSKGVVSTVQPTVDQLGAESTKSKQDYTYYLPLYRASLCGDWEKAKSFLEKDKDANRAPITSLLQTALHIAIGLKNDDAKYFIENLVKSMTDDDALAILQDSSGETPLHYAARFGNLDAAKILVQGNPNLPHVASNKGLYPIHLAAEYGYNSVDLVHYFFSVTKDSAPYTGRTGVRLLYRLICADLYNLATVLVDKFPDLATYYSDELYPLALLAAKVFVFVGPSGLNSHKRASFRESRSTSIMPQARAKSNDIENNAVDEPNKLMPKFTQKLLSLYYASSNFVRKYVGPKSEKIGGSEWKHHNAVALAECLCEKLIDLREEEINSIVGEPLLQAASCDNYKLVEIIVGYFPSSVYYRNKNKKNILHIAVENRCEDVYKLVYEMTEHRHKLMASIDSSNNTMLHLAGKLSPENKLHRTFGVALQMQRELQWFEEVKKQVPPSYYERLNNKGKKSHEVFTEEHTELKREGKCWMKDTADSCTIVAALVATIAFASAVTVPGGNDEDNGLPIFLKSKAFIVFYFSNAISLFASCNSLLGFLSILTSRYTEEDFLSKLPARLMGALADMFISIISMIISFCSTLYLMSPGHKGWISSIILVVFAGSRLTTHIRSHFPLLSALTYSLRYMLGKHDKALL